MKQFIIFFRLVCTFIKGIFQSRCHALSGTSASISLPILSPESSHLFTRCFYPRELILSITWLLCWWIIHLNWWFHASSASFSKSFIVTGNSMFSKSKGMLSMLVFHRFALSWSESWLFFMGHRSFWLICTKKWIVIFIYNIRLYNFQIFLQYH